MPWALRGLRHGVVTTKYPRRPDPYADSFVGAVRPREGADFDQVVAELCPTGALISHNGRLAVDRGRCLLCLRCTDAAPSRIGVQAGSQTSRLHRDALVVPQSAEAPGDVEQVRRDLRERTRAFGRSLHIRHVDVGSDGSDEWEVMALLNPYYDVQRLGIFFTASPKHADVLLLTGVGSLAMREPLRRTFDATPRPMVVIAAGVDAASGGITAPTYAAAAGLAHMLPDGVGVDVWVPGSPASPFALLHGLLLAVGRATDQGAVP